MAESKYEWRRVKRVTVYNSPRRARYPSITRAGDGSLLVLFSRQTAEQENAGGGELVVVRSTDEGESWSKDTVVFQRRTSEPRAVGTLTRLKSGRFIAPFATLGKAQTTSKVRLLSSDDDGKRWQVKAMKATIPLTWWVPSGRVIETAADGTLVMPVYGAASQEDLEATIHNCGLLRSRDGGQTWGEFSWIAQGPGPMIGAAPASRFSFQGPSVVALPDGRWLAMVTARRLNPTGDGPSQVNQGPGAPQVLCRLWSHNEGRTWTQPDQLTPGVWPTLAVVGGQTLCVNTLWAAWGEMRLVISENGFDSLFQEVGMLKRGWIIGRGNKPQEAPLPPTVPYLAEGWPFEHYGYPSIGRLGEDNIIVVFGRTQWGTPSYPEFDLPEDNDNPVETERIQAVFYHRSKVAVSELAPPLATKLPRPRGRWVLAERIIVPDLVGCAIAQESNGDLIGLIGAELRRSSDGGRTWNTVPGAKLPAGYPSAFSVMQSGRWLAAEEIAGPYQRGQGNGVSEKDEHMGIVGGYPVRKLRGHQLVRSMRVWYSDDEGKTWACGEPFTGPMKWAIPSVGHFIESRDGTIVLPIFGCVTEEEADSYSASNGVIRSHDGGQTWGDFSFVFRTNPKGPGDFQPEPRYSEMDIAQLPNGHWVAYSRTERLGGGPNPGGTSVALSTDFGYTWKRTGASLQSVSQQTGVVLPDGGIALTYRTHSWQAPGVAITYDEGRSFDYMLSGPYETANAFVTGEDEFVLFTSKSHRSDSSAGIYRWVPEQP